MWVRTNNFPDYQSEFANDGRKFSDLSHSLHSKTTSCSFLACFITLRNVALLNFWVIYFEFQPFLFCPMDVVPYRQSPEEWKAVILLKYCSDVNTLLKTPILGNILFEFCFREFSRVGNILSLCECTSLESSHHQMLRGVSVGSGFTCQVARYPSIWE